MLIGDTGAWVAGEIEDYKPSSIQIERMGPNSQEPTKRGAFLYIGDTLSIAKWCKERTHNEGGSVVIKDTITGKVRLDCDKDRYYTFTRQMPSSEPSSATAPTITVERPGVAPTIAVSPTRVPDRSTTAPLPSQSPKIEDLFRKGD